MKIFLSGFKSMLPITPGIVPFGAVMGTVCADAHLSFAQSFFMNIFVFAGASQLAAVDLMTRNTPVLIVLFTGLIINLRFLLYSAAMSPVVQKSKFLTKFVCAYCLTDQTYAAMSANESKFKNHHEAIIFYFGSSLCMTLVWHSSVICGFIFGNFASHSWNLDYAISLSFIALVMPTLKNKNYLFVAIFSGVLSILLRPMPFNLGLIFAAVLAIILAAFLTRKSEFAR
jgi:predicted branched-subunit amino acid permease